MYGLLLLNLVLSGFGVPADDGPSDNPSRPDAEGKGDQPLAAQFAALKQRFEAREKRFHEALVAANKLEPKARSRKITDENETFQRDWHLMADEVRKLIRAHPADAAAFEGINLLPGLMRSFLDDDLVKIVRDHFMNDPRMGQLCDALAYRSEDWSGDVLKDVAARHPDRHVRGQATYALGMWWRFGPDTVILGRDHSESVTRQCLAEAKRFFTQVCEDYADVTSTDGTFRLADKARAELARIANLPNLKVGKVAPEITGEDLDGKPLKLSDHRGKVVVVCFWATWCGRCMATVPHERALVKQMEGKPFALLGVNSDEADDREKAKQATREKQMTWPSWWDGAFRGAIQTAYDVARWPTVYVLDAEGVIRYVDVQGENLDRAVDTLLAEMEARTKNAPAR
jgi:peroxiredoxin